MFERIEVVVVYTIVTGAVIYLLTRAWRRFSKPSSGCDGCCDGCSSKDKSGQEKP